MVASATLPGGAWAPVLAGAVFVLALVVLVVDRTRLQRRLAALARAEALLETDLADARREIAALRDALREPVGRSGRARHGGPAEHPRDVVVHPPAEDPA